MKPDQQKLVARIIAGGMVIIMLFGMLAQAFAVL